MSQEYHDEWSMKSLGEDKFKIFDDHESDSHTEPPPSFPESQAQPHAMKDQPPNAEPSDLPAHPSQSHQTSAPVLTLPVQYTNWKGNYINILPAPNAPPLYTAHCTFSKPHITFKSHNAANNNQADTIGTLTFHALSTRIDTIINARPITMTNPGKLRCKYNFQSPLLGKQLTWQFRKRSTDLICVDEAGDMLARFHFGGFYWMKGGKLEIFGEEVKGRKGVLEEIVVTGVAMAHLVVWCTYTLIV